MTRAVLAVLAVAALVATPLAGVATAGSVTANTTPSFGQSVYSVHQGETAEIVVNTTGVDDGVRLTVGDAEAVNFEAAATVVDADGDGTVTVRFDTGAVHEGGPATCLAAAGDDELSNHTEHAGVDDALDPASYPLSLGDPSDPAATASLALLAAEDDETPTDAGTPTDTAETHDGTTVDTTDGEVVVESAPQQSISGETTLDPGTTLSIRVASSSTDAPFLVTAETTVADDGTFSGQFDFSDVSAGTEFEVSVRSDGRTLATAPGRVVGCSDGCPTATPTQTPGSDGTAAPSPTPLGTDEINVRSIVRVAQGDVAQIPVTFGDADALTVTVGDDEAVNYEATAVVRDTNGDGRAVVLFRTNATDDATRPALAVAENGAVRPASTANGTTLDAPVDPAPYSVAVFQGTSPEGNPATVATVVVEAADGDESDESGASGDSGAGDETAAPPGGADAATVVADGGGSGSFVTGVGALALGGLLAFGGIAMFLGYVRG